MKMVKCNSVHQLHHSCFSLFHQAMVAECDKAGKADGKVTFDEMVETLGKHAK